MNDKLCPLRQGDATGMGACVKEKCAWWMFEELDKGACAIARLVRRFVEIKIKEIGKGG